MVKLISISEEYLVPSRPKNFSLKVPLSISSSEKYFLDRQFLSSLIHRVFLPVRIYYRKLTRKPIKDFKSISSLRCLNDASYWFLKTCTFQALITTRILVNFESFSKNKCIFNIWKSWAFNLRLCLCFRIRKLLHFGYLRVWKHFLNYFKKNLSKFEAICPILILLDFNSSSVFIVFNRSLLS